MRRSTALRLMLVSCIACLFPLGAALAQSTGGNNSGGGNSISDLEQQVLQGLSPDQRDAIMNQLGIGSNNGQNGNGRRNGENQQNEMGQERQHEPTPSEQAEIDRLSPYLQAEDWVVITIDSNPLPALHLTPTPQPSTPGGTSELPPSVISSLQQNPGLGGAAGAAAALGANGSNQQGNASAMGQAAAPLGSSAGAPVTATAGGYAPESQQNLVAQLNGDNSEQPPPELTDEEKRERKRLINLIRSKNPYQLSRDGTLYLPGFAPIPLGGLTEQLASLRLGVEPALRQLFIRVTKLPLRKVGTRSLHPFGYELFDRSITTFAPVTNVPVPANYVIGAGDQLEVQLYGNQNRMIELQVGRDGRIQFPDLGPISVVGQTFDQARATIEGRVARQMNGVRASVTMADTRTIRVFVLGEAKHPGTYTISGLGTITSALFAAGGVLTQGSLRNIQLKRRGELVRHFDLYDMLIRGDSTDDAQLLPGDVIFIPPVGPTVSVDGEVRRAAIYETKAGSTLSDVLELAGGLTPEADRLKGALTRIDAQQHRVVLEVDLSGANRNQPVHDGDSLHVPRLRPTLDAAIEVEGYVYTTGTFAYHDGLRLTDVIHSVDELRPNADQHYLLIRRELPPNRRIVVLSADLGAALKAPDSPADVLLMPRDRIMVFDLQSSRDRVVQPLLDDLRLQATSTQPDNVVRVEGRVNVPGEYPLEEGMTVRDLVRAGGSLSDAAYRGKAELTRYNIVNGDSRRAELIEVDLAAALQNDPKANIRLEPFDTLSIKEVQAWDEQDEVVLRGEVRFPGKYSIKRGETLKSVLLRAGGLTDLAFVEGAVFTRKELRDREQKQLDMFAKRMQSDIAFMALQGANSNQAQAATALTVGQSLLEQLRSTRAVGRLVINLKAALGNAPGSVYDVMLRDGDELLVPKYQQEVTVIGEVQTSTSHLFRPGFRRSDYIALSGGETRRADSARVYVVRADGSVVANEGSRWFHGDATPIRPGDTVVVPLNAEHLPTLPLWQAVTQIIYNVAIAAAAVHSF